MKKKKTRDELRFDNELRKIKLNLEKGAIFKKVGDPNDLPPEVEKLWLDQIEKFEEMFRMDDMIPVYDFIGQPTFIKESELGDDALPGKLKELEEILLRYNIVCDKICDVDDRDFYKFITEEIFIGKVANAMVPGMLLHFIYEEFHPNPELDIMDLCDMFTRHFFSDDLKLYSEYITDKYIRNNDALMSFRNAFESFDNFEFSDLTFNINTSLATVNFTCSFDGYINRGSSPMHFEGNGQIDLEFINDSWNLIMIMLPGMKSS